MTDEEQKHDDMQLDGESSDGGGKTTDTEVHDEYSSGDDAADETQVVAQDTEIAPNEDVARMMEEEDEGPGNSRNAPAVGATGFVESGDGGRGGNEPTQATQIDSPPAPTQQDEDSENTESPSAGQAAGADQAASAAGTRRTPSPLRRNGLGSGVFLSRAGAAGAAVVAAGDMGAGSGFLSSAEPSAKAGRARSASSLSPNPLPADWLDDQPKADRAAAEATEGAQAQARPTKRMQNAEKRASTAATDEGAPVLPTLPPKKTSPAKAAADTAGWIRTKSSSPKGKGKKSPPVAVAGTGAAGDGDGEHATALDTPEASVSQSILAIGVPHERRVLEPPRSRPMTAVGATATAAGAGEGGDDDEEEEEEEEEEEDNEEEEMLAAGATGGTVNSQELRANEFSQIRKGCSQEKDDFNRMMDDIMAGAAAESSAAPPLSVALDEGSPRQAGAGSQGGGCGSRGTGRGSGGKRKKMRASGQAAAAEGGGAPTPRGGVAGRKGAAGPRTPGAYMGGPRAKSSTMKKREARSHQDSANQRAPTVFDFPSDDDGSDDGGRAGGRSLTGRRRASKGAASLGRNKGNIKKRAEDPAAVSKAAQTANGSLGEKFGQEEEEEEEEEMNCVVVDVRNMNGDDSGDDDGVGDDDDDGDDDEEEEEDRIVRTTQDVQMEKAMAAIRKDASSVSAPEEGKEADEEEGREDVEGEDGGDAGEGGGGEGAAEGEPTGAGRRGRGAASASSPDAKARGQRGRKPKPLPPELLTYKAMDPFLKKEGWEVVNGKGLFTWFYLIPGKKGKNGKKDVDYFVTEKDVVWHVRNDEGALGRYESFREDPAKAAGVSVGTPAPPAEGSGPVVDGSGGGGRRRSPSGSPESVARRGKKAGGEANAGLSASVEATAGSSPAQQAGGSEAQANGQARARRQAIRPPPPPPPSGRARRHAGIDWAQKWLDEWPRLNAAGWHWEYGKMGCIYLKAGFTKKTGTVGVNMFESRQAVLEYIFVHDSAAAAPPAGGSAGSAGRESVGEDGEGDAAVNKTGDGEPVVEWGLAKNRVRRTAADTNSAAPEVMVLPGRGGGVKAARSPTASTARGGDSSSGQDDGQPVRGGSGSGRQAPRARGGSKRGRGRGAAAPAAGVKRRRGAGAKAGAKQSLKGARDGARGGPSADQPRAMESGEDAVDDNDDDEADNAATQPQFELSSAINLTRLGRANASATAAATAVSRSRGGKGGIVSKTAEVAPPGASSVTSSKRPRPANGSPTASNGVGGGVGGGSDGESASGSDANGAADSTPKRKPVASSPPSSSSSAQSGSGAKRKKQRSSPTAENGGRSSSRRAVKGPFSGLGVVITGLRGDSREKLVASVEKLGGEIVSILAKKSVTKWRMWLLEHAPFGRVGPEEHPSASASDAGGTAKSKAGVKPDSVDIPPPRRRMIAVATADSDRTPKFQLAMAAGMPIVHPAYVEACTSMATEVDTAGYLLPLGRSALLGRGLIMPSPSARDRPFQGKTIMLCMHGSDALSSALDNWAFTLSAAGATLKVLQQEGSGDRKAAGGGSGPGLGTAIDASWCNLEDALQLLGGGKIFCLIGPKRANGDAVPAPLLAVEDAAVRAGTPAGSLEWAIQCMAQGRFLLPDAGTCPWFPLGATGGGGGGGGGARSGDVEKKTKGRGGGGKRRRGRGAGRGGGSRGESSGVESGPFHVHVSGGKRYVSGDYVFIKQEKGTASNDSGGAAADAAGADAAAADAVADARSRLRVARVISFRRDVDGVQVAIIPMRRGDGEKVLVASGGEDHDEEKEEVVDEEVLGARVLGMTVGEMQATQLYSLKDSGIFCLRD